jgi:hypothetical protein
MGLLDGSLYIGAILAAFALNPDHIEASHV